MRLTDSSVNRGIHGGSLVLAPIEAVKRADRDAGIILKLA